VCKRTPAAVGEALECLGGNGYVEDSGLPRLYREAPLLSIWEGSGTVNALDVLRALGREPASREALRAELAAAAGTSPEYDAALRRVESDLAGEPGERDARRLVERLGLLLQAGLLVRHSPVGEAFARARLGAGTGLTFGALPDGLDTAGVVRRAGAGLLP
jgi:putative acyl-CoA dehydrogenase